MSNPKDRILEARHQIEQLEQLIEYCYESLEIYPQYDFPEQWDKVQHDLKKFGNCLSGGYSLNSRYQSIDQDLA
jgi:hypothetical protein